METHRAHDSGFSISNLVLRDIKPQALNPRMEKNMEEETELDP